MKTRATRMLFLAVVMFVFVAAVGAGYELALAQETCTGCGCWYYCDIRDDWRIGKRFGTVEDCHCMSWPCGDLQCEPE